MNERQTENRSVGPDGLAPIVVVTSGKGGVGKTSFSVNMAAQLAKRGTRVMLIDADLGLANAHILLGIQPTTSLTEYVEDRTAIDSLISDTPCGVKLISGGHGVQKMANLETRDRTLVIDAIQDLRSYCDLLIVDTGAGIGNTVTDFIAVADQTILVTNANFAAVANAYGILKVMVQAGYSKPMHLLVNRARSTEEAKQVFSKLEGCAEQYLGFALQWLGLVPEDAHVGSAVQKRTPFSELYPETVATKYLVSVADRIEQWLSLATRNKTGTTCSPQGEADSRTS